MGCSASGTPCHHQFGNERSHRTRHDPGILAATGRRIHRSATTGPSSVVSMAPSGPPAPQAPDPLVVHLPSGIAQQGGDPAMAVATISPGQRDHVGDRAILVRPPSRQLALCRAMLAWVDACRRRQARRSETPNSPRTWSMQARRRAGLRSFAARSCGSPGRLRQDQCVQRQF